MKHDEEVGNNIEGYDRRDCIIYGEQEKDDFSSNVSRLNLGLMPIFFVGM